MALLTTAPMAPATAFPNGVNRSVLRASARVICFAIVSRPRLIVLYEKVRTGSGGVGCLDTAERAVELRDLEIYRVTVLGSDDALRVLGRRRG